MAALAALIASAPRPSGAVTLRPVVVSGQPLTAGPAGALVGTLQWDAFSDGGWAVISLLLAAGPGGVATSNDYVLLRVAPDGSQQVIAREGDPMPGTPGQIFASTYGGAQISDAGDVTFATVLLPGFISAAYLVDAAGATTLLLEEGDTAPGTSDPIFSVAPRIGPAGNVAVGVEIDGVAANPTAYYARDGAGDFALVAIEGAPAPGKPGFTFYQFDNGTLELDAPGDVVFTAYLDDPNSTSNPDSIYRYDAGGLAPVLVRGDPKPGGGTFGTFDFDGVRTNALHDVLFRTPNSLDGSIWVRHADGSFTLLARNGAQLAGMPAGNSLNQTWLDPLLNDLGQIAFAGWADTPSGTHGAVFGPTPNGVAAVALVGQQAPEMPDGVTMAAVGISTGRGWLDDDGGLAFLAVLQGPDVTASNDEILYYRRPDGSFQVIARKGQSVEVAPGDVRSIARLGDPPPDETYPPFYYTTVDLDGSRRALFSASFTDGSRAYLIADLLPACANGRDDDGDGLIDAPSDPGCRDATEASREDPACQNGLDDDGDGTIDFDGGALANGGTPLGASDPQCTVAYRAREAKSSCGVGIELLLVLMPLAAARRRVVA